MSSVPWNPPNRFDPVEIDWDEPPPPARLRVLPDDSRTVLNPVHSPDLGFRWSVNPYRGCTHACAYCYARPFHEHLGLGAGTDWERVILVKHGAAGLLDRALRAPGWAGETVVFSGITDAWQPLERRLRVTRACLEVCAHLQQPVGVITRSALVTRDLDLLGPLAALGAATVTFSIPLLDAGRCAALEPGAPPPQVRLRAMAALAAAGIPVGLSLSPVIPGLNDHEIPALLRAAREAGARFAWSLPLRLPGAVAPVFLRRLRAALPLAADRVEAGVRRLRGGALNEARPGLRFQGQGPAWASTRRLFQLWHDRLGYGPAPAAPDPSPFRVPGRPQQVALFASPRG